MRIYTIIQIWGGLVGIIESQTLWATNYKFLNDKSEMMLFLEEKLPNILYKPLLKKYKQLLDSDENKKNNFESKGIPLENVVYDDIEFAKKTLFSILKDQVYITSFCGEHKDKGNKSVNEDGLLSQWRGYGIDGGFCIVFDTKAMEECMQKEDKIFAYGYGAVGDVVYSHEYEEKYEEEFKDSIDKIVQFVCSVHETAFNGKSGSGDVLDVYTSFLNCITRYKHKGFSEENEVRLVMHLLHGDEYLELDKIVPKPIKYRDNGNEKTPYIELFDTEDIKLPIKKIIVGPHKEKESRVVYLRTLLRDTDIEVTASSIPYVG